MKGPLSLSCEMNLSQVQNGLKNYPSGNRTVREVALQDIYVEQTLPVCSNVESQDISERDKPQLIAGRPNN